MHVLRWVASMIYVLACFVRDRRIIDELGSDEYSRLIWTAGAWPKSRNGTAIGWHQIGTASLVALCRSRSKHGAWARPGRGARSLTACACARTRSPVSLALSLPLFAGLRRKQARGWHRWWSRRPAVEAGSGGGERGEGCGGGGDPGGGGQLYEGQIHQRPQEGAG